MSNDEILGSCYKASLEAKQREERASTAWETAIEKLTSIAEMARYPNFRAPDFAPYHTIVNVPEFMRLQTELDAAKLAKKMADQQLADATR